MKQTRKVEMEKIYRKIKFTKTLAKNQTAHMFSEVHTKFYCAISYNDKKYSTNYQCNVDYSKTDTENMKEDFLYCVFLDAFSYIDSRDIYDFAKQYGYDYYENSKEVKRIYSLCEKAYNKLSDMFGEDFDDLSEYIEELNS